VAEFSLSFGRFAIRLREKKNAAGVYCKQTDLRTSGGDTAAAKPVQTE
jgi:hypothetical protein